jgi:hypothetical protein
MTDESMSVAEARRLMPDTTAAMSNDEVERLVNNLDLLASAFIEAVRKDSEYRVNVEYNRGEKPE